jgi:endoglucanase
MSKLTTGPQLRGVNRAGAEFGDDWNGWTGQTYYQWPSAPVRTNELNYYAAKGMNVVRLPISWERLQHTLNGPLDPTYQANLVDYVKAATSVGLTVIIDLHNYSRYATGAYDSSGAQVNTYTQHVLGDGTLTFAHVADVWTKIATLFVSTPRVIFNLMNEQHDASSSLDSTAIFGGYQTVLNAVRATGATQLVLFPNTRSSDTHHWATWSPQGGPLDAVAALSVTDSANNLAFDMHSYTGTDSWNGDITVVTNWAHANGKHLFLSELGTTSGATAVSTLLTYINSKADVWVGWTVWNLDPYSISVTNQSTGVVSDTPKMTWYAPYFRP